jgi:TusE/DsrC/DsvC family sulfur relay protein
MATTTLAGRQLDVNEEGFLTDPTQWDEELAVALAEQIGVTLTDAHWRAIRFVRQDHAAKGETPTLRRVSTVGGIPIKELFQLFPKKPAKKMSYIAGVPKPVGCV